MAELVLIHGAGDSSRIWERQLEHFGRQHDVLALDLPGRRGRLDESAFDDHARNAEDAAGQITARGLCQPVLVGHSMGGAVVLSLALARPELPRALVLVSSGARLRIHPDFLETVRKQAETADRPGQLAPYSVPFEMVLSAATSEQTRTWLVERVGGASVQATYADFFATDRFDVMARLAKIRQPTLVLAGEDDRMTPQKYQRFVADNLPDGRLAMLPGAGHYPQIEQADAFNQALERFLAGLG